MVRLLLRRFVLSGLLVFAAHLEAADAPGSRDHPLVKRYEGSTILRYAATAFDEYVLPLGPMEGKGEKPIFRRRLGSKAG